MRDINSVSPTPGLSQPVGVDGARPLTTPDETIQANPLPPPAGPEDAANVDPKGRIVTMAAGGAVLLGTLAVAASAPLALVPVAAGGMGAAAGAAVGAALGYFTRTSREKPKAAQGGERGTAGVAAAPPGKKQKLWRSGAHRLSVADEVAVTGNSPQDVRHRRAGAALGADKQNQGNQ